ncbi:MAG: hypothetical protein RLZZ271_952 [Pseudomonadota bacterium]|jgi:DNA-binding GntR family transcriptional regulator
MAIMASQNLKLVHNSLHEEVADRLREKIYSGELAQGAYIDEAQLCESMEISRTPLREALKVLVSEGLVRHEPRRGCFVYEVTEKDLDDIFPVIALLEGRCAHEAALNATAADVQALEEMHAQLQEAAGQGQINRYYDINYTIHEAIITLADNRWLAQTIADLRKILKLARLQSLHAPQRLAQSLSEHMSVFAAIKAHDPQGAEVAMRTHLTRQRDALRELARAKRWRATS